MTEEIHKLIAAMQSRFAARQEEFRGEVTLFITREALLPLAEALRDEFGVQMLIDITAVDYFPQETPRFHLVYQLYALEANFLLRLRLPVDAVELKVPTLSGIYPSANWYEREVFDMFGIAFEGHPDLRRIIMPYDWQGHPLRKDYPLGYEEVQFTFNYEEIQVRKPQPKE